MVVPKVDFDNHMVVAIFQGGEKNNRGIVAISITEEPEEVRFRFDIDYYQSGAGAEKYVTAYGLFVIPRSTKHMVLEEDVQHQIGEPRVWQKRAEFGKLTKEGDVGS